MYCPKCKYEYRDGFFECPDCKVPLVAMLLADEESKNVEYKEVASNLRQDQISIIKSILDANDIHYFIQGEAFGTIVKVPSAIRLIVQVNDYNTVKDLLIDFV